MTGKLITVEGVDGAGKSSFLPWIERRIRAAGHDVLCTREPGGTPIGEQLRQMLLHGQASPVTEVLLMFAARREHIEQVIRPAIDGGRWVLCDRFTDATYAYQGAGRGIAFRHITMLEDWIQDGLQPDLTILFDLPVEIARARSAGVREPDRFESEQIEFFVRVRNAYLERARSSPRRFSIIDASKSMTDVEAQLAAIEALQ